MLECDVSCKRHESDIQTFYSKIIIALQDAAKLTIPFTKPHDCKRKMGKAGWNDHVKSRRSEALYWHKMYVSMGCPTNGYVNS